MQLCGEQHAAILEWLADGWWKPDAFAIAGIQGFPGIGKTQIARNLAITLHERRASLPVAIVSFPENQATALDDLILDIASELEGAGDRELAEALNRGEDAFEILARSLNVPRLIIIDDAQRLSTKAGSGHREIANLLERWSNTIRAQGRVLLLSNRTLDISRWAERADIHTLYPPKAAEAEQFLIDELNARGLSDAVPSYRRRDVVNWLGRNPRAIRLLVRSLAHEGLEDLIGLAPEAWECRDQPVSPDLLLAFERAVLQRAEERLDPSARKYLNRLSVLRRPVDRRGLDALAENPGAAPQLREELMSSFLMQGERGWFDIHPVLRETARAALSPSERKNAHAAAGRYYAAPFRAKQLGGGSDRVGRSFVEARYHLTFAEQEEALVEITRSFASHFQKSYHSTSPVPTSPAERDEIIMLLSALLQERGPVGLETFLTRCLIARGRPGDDLRALPHARRATDGRADGDTWILRLKLEARLHGADHAIKTARPILNSPLIAGDKGSLYVAVAHIMDDAGRTREAINFLKMGIQHIPTDFALYTLVAQLMSKLGEGPEAVEFLKENFLSVPADKNRWLLYQLAAETLADLGQGLDAISLLDEGVIALEGKTPDTVNLIQTSASISVRIGEPEKAIATLRSGLILPDDQSRQRLIDIILLIAYGAGLLATIDSTSFGPGQIALLRLFSALSARDLPAACAIADRAVASLPRRFSLIVQSAFAHLWNGNPKRALEILESSRFNSLQGSVGPWLGALIGVQLGDDQKARGSLEAFLGRSLAPTEPSPTLSDLLRYWEESTNDWGPTPRNHCPVLPDWMVKEPEPDQATPTTTGEGDPDFDPIQIIQSTKPEDWTGLYVLGCYDQLKTILDQQQRALSLVHALFEVGELAPGTRLGIVGGGIAGITAAAAAASKGARVTVFERADSLVHLQFQNTTRYVHPHLYHWPAPGSDNVNSGLPILPWRAGLARDVAQQILGEFEGVVRSTERIESRTGANIKLIEQESTGGRHDRVRLIDSAGDVNRVFDTIILATGFGVEPPRRLNIECGSYWENDGLDQVFLSGTDSPVSILVSGDGDGALIDLMRASLRDFRHDTLAELAGELATPEIVAKLLDIDRRARINAAVGAAFYLHPEYEDVALPEDRLSALVAKARTDTKVYFNFAHPARFRLASSPLNRFIVAMLCRAKVIAPRMGRLSEGAIQRDADGGFSVRWSPGAKAERYDRIVIRHGPPKNYFGVLFPDLLVACQPLAGRLSEMALTNRLAPATRRFFSASS